MKKASFDDLFRKRMTRRKTEDAVQITRAMRFADALLACNLRQTEAWVQAFGLTGNGGQRVTRHEVRKLASIYARTALVKRLLREQVAQLYADLRDPRTGALALLKDALRTNTLDLWNDDGSMKSVEDLKKMPLSFQLQIEKLERVTTTHYDKEGHVSRKTRRTKASLISKTKAIAQLSALLKWAEREAGEGGFSIADLVEDAERARAESVRLSAPGFIEGESTRL